MELFVVYFNPSDYPGQYVIRRHTMTGPDPEPQCVGTLEECRATVPGAFRLDRHPLDDATIVEVWV